MVKKKSKAKHPTFKDGKLLDAKMDFSVPGFTIDKKTGKLK